MNNIHVPFDILRNIVNELNENNFMDDEVRDRPAEQSFIDTLPELDVTREMVERNMECSLCLESFQEGEKCIELPCTGQSHYFHKGDNPDLCSGIKPWFEINHNCPVCRCDFPERVEENDNNNDNNENDNTTDNTIINENQRLDEIDTEINTFFNNIREELFNNQRRMEQQPMNMMHIIVDTQQRMANTRRRLVDEEDRQLQEAIELSLRDT
tara:strand:+ start:147 stop:782 length:636 start_codon:yes stop_codon:yes gene_type:complete